MPADGDLYVLGHGGNDEDGTGEWVSPRPVGEVVAEAVADATDLSTDDVDDLGSYVDTADVAAHLAGDADGEEELRFTVEDHEVVLGDDGAVDVDPE